MGFLNSPVNSLKKYQSDIYLIKRTIEKNKDHDIVPTKEEEIKIDGVIVQNTTRTLVWSSAGDFTTGLATLYTDNRKLREKNIEINPHTDYIKQNNTIYKVKQFIEYVKYFDCGIYLLEMSDDSIATI